MRYSLLDHLIETGSGASFVVVDPRETAKCSGAGWQRCVRWCGRYSRTPDQVDEAACSTCLEEEVIEGTLRSEDGRTYPIVRGIPRVLEDSYLTLVRGISEEWLRRHRPQTHASLTEFDRTQLRTAAAFGEEWGYFSENLADYDDADRVYFDLLPPDALTGMVLDAGCGMGRWAYKAGGRAKALLAVDLSSSVDQAARLLKDLPNAHVIQADIHHLPFRAETFDLIYSLGVLHHLPDPRVGLEKLVRHLKRRGRLLAYFYYALDNRPWYFHVLLKFVTSLRLVISRLPHRMARYICCAIALTVYWPLIQFGSLLRAIGLRHAARQVPLHEFYAGKSFRSLFNDSVDRFATCVEFRFTRAQIQEMFAKVGIMQVRFSDTTPYWKVLAVKRSTSDPCQTGEEIGP